MYKREIPELTCKNLPVTGLKVLSSEEGIVEMYVSVFGNKDSYNERMIFGCYAKSLSKRTPNGLFMHNWELPVAKTLDAREIPANNPNLPNEIKEFGGLYIKAQYNLKTTRGHDAFSDIEGGFIKEFSVGYKEEQSIWNKGLECKDVTEAYLYEWSSVVAGANPLTSVVSAKALGETKGKEIFNTIKSEFLGEDAESSMTFSALYDLGMTLVYSLGRQCCYDDSMAKSDRIQMFKSGVEEFGTLCSKVMDALLPEEMDSDDDNSPYMMMRMDVDSIMPIDQIGKQSLFTYREGKGNEKGLDALSELAKQVHAKLSAIGTLRAKDRNKEGRTFGADSSGRITDNVGKLRTIADDFETMLDEAKPVKVDMQLLIQKQRAKKHLIK